MKLQDPSAKAKDITEKAALAEKQQPREPPPPPPKQAKKMDPPPPPPVSPGPSPREEAAGIASPAASLRFTLATLATNPKGPAQGEACLQLRMGLESAIALDELRDSEELRAGLAQCLASHQHHDEQDPVIWEEGVGTGRGGVDVFSQTAARLWVGSSTIRGSSLPELTAPSLPLCVLLTLCVCW